jgi:hypothetical protein
MKYFVLIKGIPVPNTNIVSDIPFTRQQLEAALKELNEPEPPKPGQRFYNALNREHMFVVPDRVSSLYGNTPDEYPFAAVDLTTGDLARYSKEVALNVKLK